MKVGITPRAEGKPEIPAPEIKEGSQYSAPGRSDMLLSENRDVLAQLQDMNAFQDDSQFLERIRREGKGIDV